MQWVLDELVDDKAVKEWHIPLAAPPQQAASKATRHKKGAASKKTTDSGDSHTLHIASELLHGVFERARAPGPKWEAGQRYSLSLMIYMPPGDLAGKRLDVDSCAKA